MSNEHQTVNISLTHTGPLDSLMSPSTVLYCSMILTMMECLIYSSAQVNSGIHSLTNKQLFNFSENPRPEVMFVRHVCSSYANICYHQKNISDSPSRTEISSASKEALGLCLSLSSASCR